MQPPEVQIVAVHDVISSRLQRYFVQDVYFVKHAITQVNRYAEGLSGACGRWKPFALIIMYIVRESLLPN